MNRPQVPFTRANQGYPIDMQRVEGIAEELTRNRDFSVFVDNSRTGKVFKVFSGDLVITGSQTGEYVLFSARQNTPNTDSRFAPKRSLLVFVDASGSYAPDFREGGESPLKYTEVGPILLKGLDMYRQVTELGSEEKAMVGEKYKQATGEALEMRFFPLTVEDIPREQVTTLISLMKEYLDTVT